MVTAGSGYGYPRSTMGISSGKWYFEAKASNLSGNLFVGIVSTAGTGTEQEVGHKPNDYGYKFSSGAIRENTVETSYGDSLGTSDILGVGIDLDNNKLYFSKNGTWQNSANPETNTGGFSITAPSSTLLGEYFASASDINSNLSSTVAFNFGNPSFSITSGNSDDNGYGNFEYAPPSGYLALCTQNLATELSPTIDDGSQYFNTVLYTGNASTNDITGVGFQPDWLWIKSRSSASNHRLFDSTRGNTKYLASNFTDAEGTDTTALTSFDSDGFSLVSDGQVNGSGTTYVAWNWLANGGTTSSNSDGSITSTVQANTTAGFSIVTYTGTGSNATVGHGLSKAPEIIIVKNRDYSPSDWQTGSDYLTSWAYRLKLNGTNAEASVPSSFNSTAPTSTVINIGNNDDVNRNGDAHIIYAFHSVEGYSKIGTYTGNNNANGVFVYTGFRPSFIITKKIDGAYNWGMLDATRSSFNLADDWLGANLSNAESVETTRSADLLSNGFKARGTNGDINHDSPYLYMAFAENPFATSGGVPVTAR
jgi:hypothetical protein